MLSATPLSHNYAIFTLSKIKVDENLFCSLLDMLSATPLSHNYAFYTLSKITVDKNFSTERKACFQQIHQHIIMPFLHCPK